MARFEIEISQTAEKQIKKLPEKDQLRLVRAMLMLSEEQLPKGSRKLKGYDDVFRIRVGRYRVLYSISKSRLVILILKIGHRKDIYR